MPSVVAGEGVERMGGFLDHMVRDVPGYVGGVGRVHHMGSVPQDMGVSYLEVEEGTHIPLVRVDIVFLGEGRIGMLVTSLGC